MAPFQRERFEQIAPALLAVAHGEKPPIGNYWWEATKGASKDSDLATAMLWLLAFSPRTLDCQAAASDKEQAGELRKAARDILKLNTWLGGDSKSPWIEIQSWSIINRRTESELAIIASDVAGSHGARPHVLICNELSHVAKREFIENLMDNSAKMPFGLVCIATNAGFRSSWQYEWREAARESDRWCFNKFAEPAPWLDAADIAEARRRNTHERFLRLWEGIWSHGSGEGLAQADIEACCILEGPAPATPDNCQATIAALDLGLKRDHSALITLGIDAIAGHLRLLNVESWAPPAPGEQIDIDQIEKAVLDAQQRYNLAAVIYDPWNAAFLAQRLARHGVRMHEQPFSAAWQNVMATKLLEVFVNRRIAMYSDPLLISDLGKLSIVEKNFGYRLEAPRDELGHCDRGIALALAIPYGLDIIEDVRRQWQIEEQMQYEPQRVYA